MQLRWLALLLVAPGAAHGENTFAAKTQVYADDNRTTVVSPLTAISRDAWRGGTLGASYVADVVSSASIDVVSNATTHMSDVRSEVTGSLAQELKSTHLTGSYVYSVENDWASHTANLGVAQDLCQHNTTLSLGYSFGHNAIGRAGDHSFRRTLLTHRALAGWIQTLGQNTILQLGYTFMYDDGYQASPYRFVRVESFPFGAILYKVPETVPNERVRHALVLAVNRHLFTDSALQGDVRYYFDSWGIHSVTAQLRYLVAWKSVTLRLRERFYYQTGADFFRSHYTEAAPFMTADRELSSFWSNLLGAKLSVQLPWLSRAISFELKGDFFYYQYRDYALLASRIGGVAELGLSAVY